MSAVHGTNQIVSWPTAGDSLPGRAKSEEREPNMPSFIDAKNLKPFISSDLMGVLKLIEYKDSKGSLITGYKAGILP